MIDAQAVFTRSIKEARQQTILYDFLTGQIRVPVPFEDFLRAQVVVAVAAFDKLMHDIIRIGVCQAFAGARAATPKYLGESISIELHSAMLAATLPPKELLFEQWMISRLRHLSFQHPDRISDDLALIWDERQKWNRIGNAMGMTGEYASTKMKLIAGRRNAIVHESDMDPLINAKTPISRPECADVTDFVEACGHAIVSLVL